MSAASKFKSQRDEFYRDLAEAFAASESLFVFLSRRREFCDDQGQKAMADLYDGMITRMDESSNIADIIGDTVPAGDTLSLLSIDAAEDDNNRA